jgi:beta-galactosidase
MVYTSIARGADSLLFFRWRTCRFGAEAYWCGILDHDNVSRRRYDEVQKIGRELAVIGPEIIGTHVWFDVGIAAADVDVVDAHNTMSFGLPSPDRVAEELHASFLKQGYAVGCVHPSDDLTDLKVYVIPHWTVFDPAWVPNLQSFVEGGGVLIVGARTATKDWQNNVIADTPPGVLSELAGVRVAEYGRQNAPEKRPLVLRFYPGDVRVTMDHWYEQLDPLPGTATWARWEKRHLRLKSAVTMRKVGEGVVIYVGTYLNAEILSGLMAQLTGIRDDLLPLWATAPEGVDVVVREDGEKALWFFINNKDLGVTFKEPPDGTDLITGRETTARLYLAKNGVAVIKQVLVEVPDQGTDDSADD